MKKVILCPNPYRDKGLAAAKEAEGILRSVGLETVYCLPFKPEGGEWQFGVACRPLQQELRSADLLIAFGGDGTILHLARASAMRGVPVLGVNLGSLGFMSDLEVGEMGLLKELSRGRYRREKRMMLDVSVLREGRTVYQNSALNDAVVSKGAVARVIRLQVSRGRSGGGNPNRVHRLLSLRRGPGGGAHSPELRHQPHLRPHSLFQILCPLRRGDGDRGPGGGQPQAGVFVGGRRQSLLPAPGG